MKRSATEAPKFSRYGGSCGSCENSSLADDCMAKSGEQSSLRGRAGQVSAKTAWRGRKGHAHKAASVSCQTRRMMCLLTSSAGEKMSIDESRRRCAFLTSLCEKSSATRVK